MARKILQPPASHSSPPPPPTVFPVSELKALKLPSQPAWLLLKNTSISVPSGPHCDANESESVIESRTWKMLAPYGVLQAFSRLSFPVLTNHLPSERKHQELVRGGRTRIHSRCSERKHSDGQGQKQGDWGISIQSTCFCFCVGIAYQRSFVHAQKKKKRKKFLGGKRGYNLTTVGEFEGENAALMQV